MKKVLSPSSANSAAWPTVKKTVVPRILGIDPGYDRLGWAILAVPRTAPKKLLAAGLITTNKEQTFYKRLQTIDHDLSQVIAKYQPNLAAMESLFFQNNQKTAFQVAEARGVIKSCLFRAALPLVEYTPLQVKVGVTGHGQATKDAVAKMVRLEFSLSTKTKIIDDTLDAIAIALTHSASLNLRQLSPSAITPSAA